MDTQTNSQASVDTSVSVDTGTSRELNPGFEGETITLAEAMSVSKTSKVTLLKLIKDKKIPVVGYVKSQKRGRPANLYERSVLLSAIHSA
jgi:hypothetical protein